MSWQQASPDLTEGSTPAEEQNANQSGAANRARNAAISMLSFFGSERGGDLGRHDERAHQMTRECGQELARCYAERFSCGYFDQHS